MTRARRRPATACRAIVAATVGAMVAVALPTAPAAGAEPVTSQDPAAIPADRVMILQTDSAADATSRSLHDAAEDLGATVRHTFGAQHAVSVRVPAGADVTSAAARLATLPGVTRVEPAVRRSFTGVPDDRYFASQRTYLDAVAAPTAWDTQHGSSTVKIAVIDSGVDVNHPDLKGKVSATYNATARSGSVVDAVGHGTFVAGVAAANTGNGVGVAGAGYDTSILAVKVDDDYGDIAIDDEVAGIRWAADHGANVINLSLSGPVASEAERQAVAYAQAKGIVVVAAAGNENTTARGYPAAYPGVISVAATDTATKKRASFSNHGSWVTLAAPGVNILSTTPTAGSEFFPGKSGYSHGDGTSFSAPLVAGAAALLRAQNPAASATAIRDALIASAHGYAGNDVGRGQVDFALALQHVPPASMPSAVTTTGTGGDITLSAASSAPKVAFRIDGQPYGSPVAVSGGTASSTWTSFGYAQGTHTISAVDCSAFGDCNTSGREADPVALDNATPSVTPPARISGPASVSASAPGGGLRLLVDAKEIGFDDAAPYQFAINGSLVEDGTHQVTVQSCTSTHSRCEGPSSDAVSAVFDSLHPTLGAPDHDVISPNGDGSIDAATFGVALPGATSARVDTIDASGVVRRSETLPVTAGSWTFRGVDDSGRRLPDGRYRIALYASSADRDGLAERSALVDTVAPRLGAVTGANALFYPIRDGYRDTFAPSASLPDGGAFTLAITTASGHAVRTLATSRPVPARVSLAWNGRDSTGHLQKSGSYRWRLAVTDAAGNTSRSPVYRVSLSTKRLRTQTVTLGRDAATKARGSAHCAGKIASRYRHGVHLRNRCTGKSEDVGYAGYTITLPAAYRYGRLSFQVYGRSARTSQLTALIARADGGLEVPRPTKVKATKGRWRTVVSASASGRVSHRKVRVALLLTPHFAGTNDFDARSVRLRVTLTRLR